MTGGRNLSYLPQSVDRTYGGMRWALWVCMQSADLEFLRLTPELMHQCAKLKRSSCPCLFQAPKGVI